MKIKEKQKPSSSEDTVRAKVREDSPRGRVKLRGIGFVKKILSWE